MSDLQAQQAHFARAQFEKMTGMTFAQAQARQIEQQKEEKEAFIALMTFKIEEVCCWCAIERISESQTPSKGFSAHNMSAVSHSKTGDEVRERRQKVFPKVYKALTPEQAHKHSSVACQRACQIRQIKHLLPATASAA
tara:strand:+ start:31627 stop:32040 length:414 start_codon:yes stop_codon:yes gene_type:complete